MEDESGGVRANIIVAFEALTGLFGFALATGLLFARSLGQAHKSSTVKNPLSPRIAHYRLMFRIVNERRNQLIEVNATLTFSRMETHNGKQSATSIPFLSSGKRSHSFPYIGPSSIRSINRSLFGVSQKDLEDTDAEFSILLTAIDETFSQTVHSRSSYKYDEVVVGQNSGICLSFGGWRDRVDMRRLSEIEPA